MKKIAIIKADNGGFIVKEKAGITVWKDFPDLWRKLSDFLVTGLNYHKEIFSMISRV